jgi:hypothetical protein
LNETSLVKKLDKLELVSPAGILSSMAVSSNVGKKARVSFGLTPLIADMADLNVAS